VGKFKDGKVFGDDGLPSALSRAAGSEIGKRGKLSERSEFFAPPIPEVVERGRLSGAAALSFGSFLWASKEKNAPPAGRRKVGMKDK
jgi:hypothetical protein